MAEAGAEGRTMRPNRPTGPKQLGSACRPGSAAFLPDIRRRTCPLVDWESVEEEGFGVRSSPSGVCRFGRLTQGEHDGNATASVLHRPLERDRAARRLAL